MTEPRNDSINTRLKFMTNPKEEPEEVQVIAHKVFGTLMEHLGPDGALQAYEEWLVLNLITQEYFLSLFPHATNVQERLRLRGSAQQSL